MTLAVSRRCIALLGGSFDPIHNGHMALARYFAERLQPDELRMIPAGNPWQKDKLQASAEDRVAMLQYAFNEQKIPVAIDLQEIQRHTATYSIDTLRTIRAEVGPETSIVFMLGADQLQQLDTWKEWQRLFDYAHICAASRPGFSVDAQHMPQAVAQEFTRRTGTLEQIRTTPYGLTYLAADLAVEVSSTEIRASLQRGTLPDQLVPHAVLDYIKQHHLYKS
ncbi:MAG: nicotinate-nucleotide adenylyltransferase [Burkholderiaceae bacterium]